MSESSKPSSQSIQVAQSVLPESMRQQYLKAMGIQTWYDPALVIDKAILSKPDENLQAVTQQASSAAEHVIASSNEQHEPNQVESVAENLQALNLSIEQCQLCELHTSRKQVVVGEGNVDARLMIVSDAPVDDATGDVIFKIQQRKMLEAMLKAIDIDLASVYLTSLVKCQPPEQRAPYTSEMICCDDHLSAQIKLIQPEVIMLLGEQACQQLLVSQKCLSDLRLRQHQHLGVPVYASYHPEELFNSAENKSKVWQDLLQISKHLTN